MLAVTMLILLSGTAFVLSYAHQVRYELEATVEAAGQALSWARNLARGAEGDANWGVKVNSGQITLFRGGSYAARRAGFDKVFPLPKSVNATGTTEIVFARLTGYPLATGTIMFFATEQATRTIAVNARGTISE